MNRKLLENIYELVRQNKDYFDDFDYSLEMGNGGLLIYYYYHYHYFKEEAYLKIAREEVKKLMSTLEQGIKEFKAKYRTDSLSNSLSGLGKSLLFIEHNLDNYWAFKSIHDSLYEYFILLNKTNFKNRDFDFNSGALSIGHYFINYYAIYQDPRSKKALLDIVEAIKENAIHHNDNEIYWKSPVLDDKIYLGLSHGSAMILNFLNKLISLKILKAEDKEIRVLLRKAVQFLIKQKRNYSLGLFPINYPDSKDFTPTQFSMCYGDLGILYSLYMSCKFQKNKTLENECLDLLISCAKRKKNLETTYDGSIIYGASGLYILFDQLCSKEPLPLFIEARDYWLDNITKYRSDEKTSYVGFKNMFEDQGVNINLSFGWGLIGIAISLMTGYRKDMPKIDELTMIGMR